MSSANLAPVAPLPEITIAVRDVVTHYGKREVLHGINLEIRKGETMVILGGSGSGKSTLIRHLVGLEKVTSGAISASSPNGSSTRFAARSACPFRDRPCSIR
jgi:ABC-type sugar transport system ATPase subunit